LLYRFLIYSIVSTSQKKATARHSCNKQHSNQIYLAS